MSKTVNNPIPDHEKTPAHLIKELRELRASCAAPQGPKWAPVPAFPSLEISEDGQHVRLVKAVRPQKDGTYAVTVDGRAIRHRLPDLHKAAWPALWPALAGPAAINVRGAAPELPLGDDPETDETREELLAQIEAAKPRPLTPDELRAVLARFG